MTGKRITSLGLFILDDFEYRTPSGELLRKSEQSEIGGGGTYFLIGARIWLPPSAVGLLVDRGDDFEVQDRLDAYGPDCWHYRRVARKTTRALNLYTGEHREFKYLSERSPLEPKDLPLALRDTEWIHYVCSPLRAHAIEQQLSTSTSKACYEPIDSSCVLSELDNLIRILPSLAIFSPNHEEAASFFGISPAELASQGKQGIEAIAQRFVEAGALGWVVIRSGARGAYAVRRDVDGFWTDAYHTSSEKVVDVTGAGNAFLGGLCAGMVRYPQDFQLALFSGSISAAYTIEQFGLPSIDTTGEVELCNGSDPEGRLEEMKSRKVASE